MRLASIATLALSTSLATADDFDTLRDRWAAQLTGGSTVDTADPDIAAALAFNNKVAQTHWSSMERSADRVTLWPDLADWTKSGSLTSSYSRLALMANAYATPGTELHGNPALAADIVSALDWLNAKHYNARSTSSDNWWDWQIGTPRQLNNCMALMHAQLGAARIANYIAAIDRFVPDPTQRLNHDGTVQAAAESGGNRTDKALIVVVRGILGKSPAKIEQGRDAFNETLSYVTSGDGFYRDGSFVQHSNIAYTGGYGTVLLDGWSKLLPLLSGSRWSVSATKLPELYEWVWNAFRPFIYNGAFMDAVKGRGLSRSNGSDHLSGRSVIAALLRLAEAAPAADAAALRSLAKGWIQRDTYFGPNYFAPNDPARPQITARLPLHDMALLKALMADKTIVGQPEATGTHIFAGMDRVVQRAPGMAMALSLFSDRISAFEYGNGENATGWWTGIGMMNLYNADAAQYDDNFWPLVDMRRLAGTTTDRSGTGVPKPFAPYLNASSWAGGAEMNTQFAAVGLNFSMSSVTGTSLHGKKAWFLFDDKIVAMGGDISSSDGVPIETIVENRKLNASGSNRLTIDKVAKPTTRGWHETMPGVAWAHLAGSVGGSDIGYYFPGGATIAGLREQRAGSWRQINSNDGANATLTGTFLSLAVPHGIDPTAASYVYVVLPNRSASDMMAFAAKPTLIVVQQTSDAFAVLDGCTGVLGATFWNDASATVSLNGTTYLSSNRRAAVLVREAKGMMQVAVADPTHENKGAIEIDIGRPASSVASASAGIQVLQLSPSIKIKVSVNGAAGGTKDISFNTR